MIRHHHHHDERWGKWANGEATALNIPPARHWALTLSHRHCHHHLSHYLEHHHIYDYLQHHHLNHYRHCYHHFKSLLTTTSTWSSIWLCTAHQPLHIVFYIFNFWDFFGFIHFLVYVLASARWTSALAYWNYFSATSWEEKLSRKTDAHFQPIGQKVRISLTWSVAANLTFPSLIMNSMQCSEHNLPQFNFMGSITEPSKAICDMHNSIFCKDTQTPWTMVYLVSEKEGKIQLGKGNWWQKWRSNWMSLPVDRRGMLAVFTLAERPLAG